MAAQIYTIGKPGQFNLTRGEDKFLQNLLSEPNLYNFLMTTNKIRIPYNNCLSTKPSNPEDPDYKQFFTNLITKYQEYHQFLRRLMSKTPYIISDNKVAYSIVDDHDIPKNVQNGTLMALGYKLLLMIPKYDIGKHKTLLELVFPFPVRIIPVQSGRYFILDENHVFVVSGMERRNLPFHPSHGHEYHIDIYRLILTSSMKPPGYEDYAKRFELVLRCEEKSQALVKKTIWKRESEREDASRSDSRPEASSRPDEDKEFANFQLKVKLEGLKEETIRKIYLLSHGYKDLIVKFLFKIHSHKIKLAQLADQVYMDKAQDVSYADLEKQVSNKINELSSDLDSFMSTNAPFSSNKFTLFAHCTAKHFDKIKKGDYVRFDNFLTGYTSTDSVTNKLLDKSYEIILVLMLPPRTPVLIIPDQVKQTKLHNIIIMPRNMTLQVENIKPVKLIENPKTYRKVYYLRFNRINKGEVEAKINHSVTITYDDLKHLSRL